MPLTLTLTLTLSLRERGQIECGFSLSLREGGRIECGFTLSLRERAGVRVKTYTRARYSAGMPSPSDEYNTHWLSGENDG